MNLLQREVLVELHIAIFRDEGYRMSGVQTNTTKLLPRTPENKVKCVAALLAAVADWAKQNAEIDLDMPPIPVLIKQLSALIDPKRPERTVFYG